MSIAEFDGQPSWPLDASKTGESTKCPNNSKKVLAFEYLKRTSRKHGKIFHLVDPRQRQDVLSRPVRRILPTPL